MYNLGNSPTANLAKTHHSTLQPSPKKTIFTKKKLILRMLRNIDVPFSTAQRSKVIVHRDR